MGNLEVIDRFLRKHYIPKVNEKEIENLNTLVTSMEIKTIIKNI